MYSCRSVCDSVVVLANFLNLWAYFLVYKWDRLVRWPLQSSHLRTTVILSKGTGASAFVGASELSPFCWVPCPGSLSITLACCGVGVTELLCGCPDVPGVLLALWVMVTSVCPSFVVWVMLSLLHHRCIYLAASISGVVRWKLLLDFYNCKWNTCHI